MGILETQIYLLPVFQQVHVYKDTMQLSSFYNNRLPLGISAMKINQGIPKFIIKELEKKHDLKKLLEF